MGTIIATTRLNQAIRNYGEEFKVWELHSHIKQFTPNQLLTINLFHPTISKWAAQSTLSPLMCLVLTHHASTKFNVTFSRNPVWITFLFRWINHVTVPRKDPRKDSDSRKDWRQEEKGMTEDEMVGWHHRLNGHEFEQAPVVGDGQGSLACCSLWGHRVGHNWVPKLNWTVPRITPSYHL